MQIALSGQRIMKREKKPHTHTHNSMQNSNICFISNSEIHAIKYKVIWQDPCSGSLIFFSTFTIHSNELHSNKGILNNLDQTLVSRLSLVPPKNNINASKKNSV